MEYRPPDDSPRKVYLKDGLFVASTSKNANEDDVLLDIGGKESFDQVILATEGECRAFMSYPSPHTKEGEREAVKNCFKALTDE